MVSWENMSHEARELSLFIENDSQLYHGQTLSIQKNLLRKMKKGTFDKTKAVKLWMYLVEAGAKKYGKEYGGAGDKWHQMFSMEDRRQVAKAFNESFIAEAKLGNYDDINLKIGANPCGRKRTNPVAEAYKPWRNLCTNCGMQIIGCHNGKCPNQTFRPKDKIFCQDMDGQHPRHWCLDCARKQGLVRLNENPPTRSNPRKEVDWKKGYLTEAEVNLLKNRMNRGEKVDLQPLYDAEEMNLTPDQVKKGFNWLWNLYKTPKGKERSRHPFGYREIRALESFKTITLIDFYNAGNAYRDFYVPFYAVNGKEGFFEYAVYGGELHILG